MSEIDSTLLETQIKDLLAQGASHMTHEQAQVSAARRARIIELGKIENVLPTGSIAPDFTLPDAFGSLVKLSELLAKGPVVLNFYRGDWCPFCNLTLRAYQATLPEFQKLGATLVAVSPQNPDKTLLTAQGKELTYPVLSDLGNKVARQYGVVWTIPEDMRESQAHLAQYNEAGNWELPMPGTFVISPAGVITWVSVDANFTHRVEPAAILVELKKIAAIHLN